MCPGLLPSQDCVAEARRFPQGKAKWWTQVGSKRELSKGWGTQADRTLLWKLKGACTWKGAQQAHGHQEDGSTQPAPGSMAFQQI